MENKSHALAAGTFVLLLVALLIAAALWLTRDTRAMRVFVLVGPVNVAGLQPQATVRFRGVPVGKVTAIELDPQIQGQVLVRIAVDDQAPITSATVATLGVQGVTGLAFIALENSATVSTALPTGAELPGRIPLHAGLLSKLTDQGERLLGQLEQSSQRFNQLLAPTNQQTFMNSVDRLGQAGAELQLLSTQARQAIPKMAQSGQDTLDIIKATSKRVGDSADEARASARAFRLVTERMYAPGGTLDQINQGVDILVATGQTLRITTLPRLNQAVQEAVQTTHQLGDLTQTLSDNPQALLLGKPNTLPGPGESGFVVPSASAR